MIVVYSIYKVTNKANNKIYIGFSSDFNRRLKEHKSYFPTVNCVFYRAIRKYGWNNFTFEIIYQSLDYKHCLVIMEPHFIKEFNSIEYGYNSTSGGEGTLGFSHTEQSRTKMSKSRIGKSPWNKGKTGVYSQEFLEERSRTCIFRTLEKTEEHKRNISKSLIGKKKSKEHIDSAAEGRSKEYTMLDPDDKIIFIKNMSEFCRNNNLNQSHMISVYLGRYGFKSHKGYKKI